MKRIPIIPIKWINEGHDTDQDGVPNYRDCQPFNPHKQDEKIRECVNYLILNWGVPYTKAKELIFKHRMPWKRDESGAYMTKDDLDRLGKIHGRVK